MIGTSGVVTRDKRDKRGRAVLSGWLDPPQGIVINLGGIAVTISRSHDTSVDALRCVKKSYIFSAGRKGLMFSCGGSHSGIAAP